MPKISVLMSVYNGSVYLRESVESILNQTFTDFEFIIINDCSTDDSWAIINEYAEKDSRIVLIDNQENIGLTKSLNKGLEIAQAEYIARKDADDISLPQRFEKQVKVLDEQSNIVLVSCDLEVIDSEGKMFARYKRACKPVLVKWYLLFYNYLAGHSQVMFRREPVINLGGYDETYRYAQDYQLWCSLAKVGDILIIPEILLKYRVHHNSVSSEKKEAQDNFVFEQIKNNVSELLEAEVTLKDAKHLKGFWLGNRNSSFFPCHEEAEKVGKMIVDINQKFISQFNNSDSPSYKYVSSELDLVIGEQYISWIRALNIQNNLSTKIKVSVYAFRWHPLGVIKRWLIDLVKESVKLATGSSGSLSNLNLTSFFLYRK